MSFTVRVVDEEGNEIEGKKVALGFHGITRGMSSDEWTDSEGRAVFDDYDDGGITVYVDGDSYGDFYYEDGEEVTVEYEYDTW